MKFKINPEIFVRCDSLLYFCLKEQEIIEPILEIEQANFLYALVKLKDFTESEIMEVLNLTLKEAIPLIQTLISRSVIVPANTPQPSNMVVSAFHLAFLQQMISKDKVVTYLQLKDIDREYKCIIIDNFFVSWVDNSVHTWLLQLPFRRVDVDDYNTTEYKHWVFYLSPPFLQVCALPFLRLIDKYVVEHHNLQDCYLKRAHIYAGSSQDVYFSHRDSKYEKATTVLYYPSSWKEEWGGELLFYNGNELSNAVGLKPGRIVIFPGCLRHRIGAISTVSAFPRYSIVLRYDSLLG